MFFTQKSSNTFDLQIKMEKDIFSAAYEAEADAGNKKLQL